MAKNFINLLISRPWPFSQVESLRHQCDLKEAELQKSTKKAQEAMALAAEEAAKCKAAKDVIKSLTAQVFSLFFLVIQNPFLLMLRLLFYFSPCREIFTCCNQLNLVTFFPAQRHG